MSEIDALINIVSLLNTEQRVEKLSESLDANFNFLLNKDWIELNDEVTKWDDLDKIVDTGHYRGVFRDLPTNNPFYLFVTSSSSNITQVIFTSEYSGDSRLGPICRTGTLNINQGSTTVTWNRSMYLNKSLIIE